ncbi:MAG: hypothetical protein ACXWMH_04260, partial [Syntrophales bacterium]
MEDKTPQETPTVSAQGADFGNLENITLDRINGKERVTLVLSKRSGVAIESLGTTNGLLVKMAKVFVP